MRTLDLLGAIPYLRAYAGQIFVVKAGGELLERPAWRDSVARDMAVLHRLGIRVVFVHGGGPQLDAATGGADKVAGRRVTSADTLAKAVQVWKGTLSLDWVTALEREGEKAVGISGVDGPILRATRRPPISIRDDAGVEAVVDFGEVGDVREVDVSALRAVLSIPAIPVLSPLALSDDYKALNVNADTVAAAVAVGLGAAKLILLTQAPGILSDPDDAGSVLHWTDLEELSDLEASGALRGGMRPKVAAIRKALDGGVPRVHVLDGRRQGALLEEVLTTDGSGTLVVKAADEAPAEPI
ncbi:MAG: acetylglutamate kinase [Deltaproteobacteria bacterium]|nr:acetylglutamate kinase [Deltaproteobacteria bacterium]